MKKALFVFLSIMACFVAFVFTFGAAFLETQDGRSLVDVYLLSYSGVIVSHVALEIIKILCFKRDYKKVYAFDVISILLCLSVIIILNLIHLTDKVVFWAIWKEEFFLYRLPWHITIWSYVALIIFKSTKKKR